MTQLGLSIEIDKRDIAKWQQRFEHDISNGFARANKFVLAMNGTGRRPATKTCIKR